MDTTHADASTSRLNRFRAIEPVVFFTGVVLSVVIAIALIVWEAHAPIGPVDRELKHAH